MSRCARCLLSVCLSLSFFLSACSPKVMVDPIPTEAAPTRPAATPTEALAQPATPAPAAAPTARSTFPSQVTGSVAPVRFMASFGDRLQGAPADLFSCDTAWLFNFSKDRGLAPYTQGGIFAATTTGKYKVEISQNAKEALFPADVVLGNALIQVTGNFEDYVNGSIGLAFGIRDNGSFYAFMVEGEGRWALRYFSPQAGWETLISDDNAPFVLGDLNENRLAVAVGKQMVTMFVNGMAVGYAMILEKLEPQTRAGLVVTGNTSRAYTAVFDDLSICPLGEVFPMNLPVQMGGSLPWKAGNPLLFDYTWYTTAEHYSLDFIRNATFSVKIDGVSIPIEGNGWSTPVQVGQNNATALRLIYRPLPVGRYTVDITGTLSKAVEDGFDLDSNNQLDVYGPGEVFSGSFTLVVE